VAIFIGCLGNYNYRQVGESLLSILKHLEIDAFLAKAQKCCSAPAYFTGDFNTVDYLAKHNIEYFEQFIDDVEAIIVPEATCSAMIKIDYEHYFHGFGGVTMQTEKYHFAKAVGVVKAAMIKQSGASVVSAECSACRMQINDSMYQANVDVVFKNPIELIAQVLEER